MCACANWKSKESAVATEDIRRGPRTRDKQVETRTGGYLMGHFFASQRLIARSFTPLDLDIFVAMRAEPEVARFENWETFTENDGRAFLEANAVCIPGEPGWFQFALECKEDGKFIGDCGLKTFETDNRLAQIGYTVARQYWGQGYATEAVRGLINYAFSNFPIHRIIASVDPRNAP
jgi:RimJ/RimL family protein N-acetyltransferase